MPTVAPGPPIVSPEILKAKRWARIYKGMGYNPLPSSTFRKMPAIKGGYAKVRDEGVSESILERWWTPNIQLALGVHPWNICILDLDGREAVLRFEEWEADHEPIVTWEVQNDPDGGKHLWLEPFGVSELPHKKLLWENPDEKHVKIELLGDRNLIVAPPSIHTKTGRVYKFVPGRSPSDIPRPAKAPAWLLDLPDVTMRRDPPTPRAPRPALANVPRRGGGNYGREEVQRAIPAADKRYLAGTWGMVFAVNSPNSAGWSACYRAAKSETNPSGSFHEESGCYWESGQPTISFFDLGVLLGAYVTWNDCCNDLGNAYL